jgi:FkbM family methyltransferase
MLTRDEVIWAFRYCFGRNPESEETILAHSGFSDWLHLRDALMNTEEFATTATIGWLADRWVLAPVMDGTRMMWLNLADRYVSRACLLDNYEPIESQFVRRMLRPDSVFLDIGANIGWFTMIASTLIGDKGRIHAFEPRPETVAHLKRTIEVNKLGAVVDVHNCALSAAEGVGFINWSKNTDNPGGSFLSLDAPAQRMENEKVAVRTLDSFELGRVDFIKIDVEGSEMKAIKGGEATIFSSRPVILTEINPNILKSISGISPNEFIDYFRNRNYKAMMLDRDCGEFEIERFPPDWPHDIANVAMMPI